MSQKYASWAAKDTRESSSLPSDFDAAIAEAKFTKEPPDNYPAEGNPIFAVVTYHREDNVSEEERTLPVHYNLGGKAGDEFTISDDGYGLVPINEDCNAIRKGSKFDLWKCSLEQEGVSAAITEAGNLAALVGLRGHWRRIEDAKLLGKAREFGDDKRKSKFPPQTLVCVKLLGLPGEKGKGTTANATTGSTAGNNGGDFDLDAVTMDYLLKVIDAEPTKTVQRATLVMRLSKAAMADVAHRKEIAKRGSEEAYLVKLAEAGIVSFDPASKPQVVGAAA